MTLSNHRTSRAVLIPWVITLVALFGLNALAPGHMRTRKNDAPEIAGLSQATEDAQTSTRLPNLPLLLAPQPTEADWATSLKYQLLSIESHCQQMPLQACGGAIHGRAPPARPLA